MVYTLRQKKMENKAACSSGNKCILLYDDQQPYLIPFESVLSGNGIAGKSYEGQEKAQAHGKAFISLLSGYQSAYAPYTRQRYRTEAG